MELLVQPQQRHLDFSSGQNLLELLRTHDLPVSYSCLSGRCGLCRCTVTRGQVLGGQPAAGTGPGRESGGDGHEVLACQAVLTEPCTITLPDAGEVVTHPARILKGTVQTLERLTPEVLRLRVATNKPLDYSPGQYATLQFTPEHIRPYSMAGIMGDEGLEFHIRHVPGGRVTDYLFQHLQVGATVRVSGPLGTAYLRQQHTGPMLCVGTGTGLAPVLSILRGALAAGMSNPLHIYVGARTQTELYDWQRLCDLAAAHPHIRLHGVIATGPVPSGLRAGLVTEAIAADLGSLPDLRDWRAYLCGAPLMVQAMSLQLQQRGIPARQLHADAFYPTGI